MDNRIAIATSFIDAFYSFDKDSLESNLSHAKNSWGEILFYQKWAECGNYKVLKRHPIKIKDDTTVLCPITVKDDLMSALDIPFNVTDVFHITIIEGKIRAVSTTSNDPDIYYQGKEWIKKNRPDLYDIPCKDAWEGGPTPCKCVKATIQGLKEFRAATK